MQEDVLKHEIVEILVEALNLSTEEIESLDFDKPLKDQIEFASLDLLIVGMHIKDNYKIALQDEEFVKLDTVNKIIDYVQERRC